ncbi:tetratricopeptide repeat-containing sulfotransferase family protein [Marinobacter alexandrii]|uniref:tetratricopeptide repeat-containing sulfotransferase family protein n=1 Tax=Marinobacter alexandrii TaxID=2570351 RepID=UPI0032993439
MSSTFLQQAERAHQEGNLDHAVASYNKALETGEETSSALYGLGTVAMQRQQYPEAVRFLQDAASREPNAADILLSLAQSYFRAGENTQASETALKCASLCREHTGMSNAVARLLLNLGQPAAVAHQLQRLKKHDSASTLLLARALAQTTQWDEAVKVLRELVASQPEHAQATLELSQAAARLRDYALAMTAFSQYMKLVGPDADKCVRFADLLLMAREVDAAWREIEQAGALGADSADFHLIRARILHLKGEDAESSFACDAALARDSGLGQAWQLRIETTPKKELDDMIQAMRRALDRTTYDPFQHELLLYALGDAYRKQGSVDEATVFYRQANTMQRQDLEASGLAYKSHQEVARIDDLIAQYPQMLHESSAVVGPTPVFIVGMPRSGTTLVEKILGQFDGVTALGESEALGIVEAELQREQKAGRLPDTQDISPDQWRLFAHRYLELSSCSTAVQVDKMPHNFLRVGMILAMFPQAHVIQMHRDPRDVCLSIFTRPFAPVHNYACDSAALPEACEQAARLMNHWSALDSTRVINMSFEELVRDPVAQSQRLAAFCGLSWSEHCLDFHESVTPSFTFSERQVRSVITDQGVGQWKAYADSLPELFERFSV